jgi:regulatory protein YycI of two-component signal transduction system YycFG
MKNKITLITVVVLMIFDITFTILFFNKFNNEVKIYENENKVLKEENKILKNEIQLREDEISYWGMKYDSLVVNDVKE